MTNVVNTVSASTLEKCKALLEEIVPQIQVPQIPRESPPRPARTGSDAIQNEHRRLFGFQYRGGGRGWYNPFSRGRDRADGGARGALAPPPPPHFFARIKIN